MAEGTNAHVVQDAADALGELLLRSSGDPKLAGYELLAKVTLQAGLKALIEAEPAPDRVDKVARAVYDRMHGRDSQAWTELDNVQRNFWHDIAKAAIQASDEGALASLY